MGQYLLLSATFRDRDCKRNLYQSVAQRSYAILGYTVSVNGNSKRSLQTLLSCRTTVGSGPHITLLRICLEIV